MVKNDTLAFLEGRDATRIILVLYQHKDKIKQSELQEKAKVNAATITRRVEELKSAGIIDFKIAPTVKDGKIIGGSQTKWIWLTPKGKKVAEKLAEIKEIMEKE